MPGQVHVAFEGTTATVTLDNPGRRNAVSFALFQDLHSVITEVSHSPEVQAVIVTGQGTDFSVGADLAAAPESRTLRRDSVAADTARLRQVSTALLDFHRMPQITIAAIDGACAGAGLSLAAAADFRIASDRAVFNTAFVNAGLSGDLGGVWLINNMLGAARARELFLAPEKLSASRAQQLGLVTAVESPESLHHTARELAGRLGALSPLALRAMKQNLLQSSLTPLSDYLLAEVDRMVQCFHSDDSREAAEAFLHKRRPAFTGR
ncbi:enoyl-CoA hydratase/isomerase family protein [Rhodococcus jostii]|uniref:2-(1,2-epoxy-1,2-dihydrophenyl)acetyl-CoA isomerase n=1 Tax=Rhodococcus jostii TaxID=132919 RepID=A0A1H5D673_RHOJO|nr:enoyl-CoA hydratase-related protein [Rhodococcus jostii]SED74405.1 2-(1,2-epoxy-1,2-dihydrophenyl)acetyl-CoA isomerase [Rhodococcus jostii]